MGISLSLSRENQAIAEHLHVLMQKALKLCCAHSKTAEWAKPREEMHSGLFHDTNGTCGMIRETLSVFVYGLRVKTPLKCIPHCILEVYTSLWRYDIFWRLISYYFIVEHFFLSCWLPVYSACCSGSGQPFWSVHFPGCTTP